MNFRPKTWSLFFFFLAVTAALSWAPLSFLSRSLLFPLGLLFLGGVAWKLRATSSEKKPLYLEETFPFPPALGALVLAAAFILRFYRPVSLQEWPLWDDAVMTHYAIDLSEKWSWPLAIDAQALPPVLTWLEALFFKVFPPSLFSMWLYAAFISALVVPASYLAVHPWASRSFSALYASFMAIGFPAVFWGRFCLWGDLCLVWQLVLLGALGGFWRVPREKTARWSFGLGALTAVGLYLFTVDLMTCAFVGLVMAGSWLYGKKGDGRTFSLFCLAFLALAFPAVVGIYPALLKGHLAAQLVGGQAPFSWFHQFTTFFSYPTSLFFGTIDDSYWNFGPLWGGLLNPLLGACFFLGLLPFLGRPKDPLRPAFVLGVLLCLLPFTLVNMVECMRFVQILPFVTWIVALGLVWLLRNLELRKRGVVLAGILALSLALDAFHLFGVFHRWSVTTAMTEGLAIKSPERYRAYRVLREEARQKGPGWVFGDFISDTYDQSLLVATYPFNAARNPRLSPTQAKWVGLLFEGHYQDALQKRFPGVRFYLLSQSTGGDGQLLGLALFPLADDRQVQDLLSWTRLHRSLQDCSGLMPHLVHHPDFHPVLQKILSLYPQAQGDPLLKAWTLEKVLDILLVWDDLTDALWFLGRPAEETRSYPFLDKKFSVMYQRLGMALVKGGDKARARECFRRAALFDPKTKINNFQ